jgi:prepilin-type N-terminal cleavage/methylation domain-containing protein
MSRNNRPAPHFRGFTLLEAVIGMAILSVLFGSVYRMLSGGQRGARHGQETTEQVLAEAVLFRVLERDFQAMIPIRIHTDFALATSSQAIIFAQHDEITDAIEFTILENGILQKIGYDFDPHRQVVRRTRKDKNGMTVQAEHFGPGLIVGFHVIPPANHDKAYEVTLALQSKAKASFARRFFLPGFRRSRQIRSWNYALKE